MTAVLSILETFELNGDNLGRICTITLSVVDVNNSFPPIDLAGTVLGPDDWKRADIQHYHVSSPDFMTVPFDKLDEAANFINDHLKTRNSSGASSSPSAYGGVVYVHCKSGMGRSAQVVVAYLMKVIFVLNTLIYK